ncbi:MAG: hypothetical protein GY696_34545 [Gammaproteobacteria bacterium]|nr:hypothetical protein [Gammaproteobacteria bacterium]
MAEPQLWIKGEQILFVTQLEIRETTVRLEPEERLDLEEESAQMEPMEQREETDLPGVDLIPPDKISVFNSLRQQYTNSLNLSNESLSPYTILPSVNSPEYERMANKQGVIGAQLGGQKGQAPSLGSMESETKKEKGGERGSGQHLSPYFWPTTGLRANSCRQARSWRGWQSVKLGEPYNPLPLNPGLQPLRVSHGRESHQK